VLTVILDPLVHSLALSLSLYIYILWCKGCSKIRKLLLPCHSRYVMPDPSSTNSIPHVVSLYWHGVFARASQSGIIYALLYLAHASRLHMYLPLYYPSVHILHSQAPTLWEYTCFVNAVRASLGVHLACTLNALHYVP